MTTTVLRIALLLTISLPLAAQDQKIVLEQEVGSLGVLQDRASWTSPESLVHELRSADDAVRLKALHLLGLGDQQAHEAAWASDGQEAKVVGTKVVTPDEIDLRFAALGRDRTQQAILAVQVSQMMYAAVAIPRRQGWERIALFNCWCRYDEPREFLEIRAVSADPTGPRSELILRASGGGSGIYEQDEAHFRLYGNNLRRVMSFVSRKKLCPPTDPPPRRCSVEFRWFYRVGPDAVLLEATGGFPVDKVSSAVFSLPEFQSRFATNLTCREYVWNEKEFRYDRSSQPAPCNPWKTQ